ncbi:MAG: aminoglycoside phosphotransferase family protein [Janthinobacterium lividum]
MKQAYPQKKLLSYKIISGGCANLNIKIDFEKENHPYLFRIYLRDPKAKYREQEIGKLFSKKIPVPCTYYIGTYKNYDFAITEFMSGITLRDLLLSQQPYNLDNIMFDVGSCLAKISTYSLLKPKFLLKNSNKPGNLLIFIQQCLNHENLEIHLDSKTIQKLSFCFKHYQADLLELADHHLVHGDFDPANILVNYKDGIWQISAILDWEFTFIGSMMWDMANMLRYAHLMPPSFTLSFIQGIESHDVMLPQDWQIIVYLLNLVSLMDLSIRTDPDQRPKQWSDICLLIDYFLTKLSF